MFRAFLFRSFYMNHIDRNELTLRTLTGGEKEGSGVFDEVMRAIRSQLIEEHTTGRITGAAFASTYSALMAEALAAATQFAMNYQFTNTRIKLAEHEMEQAKLNIDLIKAQITKMVTETTLIDEQRKIAIMNQDMLKVQIENESKRGLILDKQVIEMDKNLELKDIQIAQMKEQTKMIIQQTANALAEHTTITKNHAKIDAEVDIIKQKLLTEVAQTSDTINGKDLEGIVGKQALLYKRQADGYLRDAEQKAAKFYTDMMSTRVASDEDTYDLTTAKMQNEQVAQVLDVVRKGILMDPA